MPKNIRSRPTRQSHQQLAKGRQQNQTKTICISGRKTHYQRQYYTRSWSPIGKPCYAKIDANKGKRLKSYWSNAVK